MGYPQAESLTPQSMPDPRLDSLAAEQPRNFHFAVTWATLFAHFDLIESAGPWSPSENPSPSLALVPVVAPAPPMLDHPPRDSGAAWDMVVPRMRRTGSGSFTRLDEEGREVPS